MRIAYICMDPGVPVFGWKGCSVHVQEVLRALSGRGARIELFARRLKSSPPPDLESISIHTISVPSEGGPAAREQAALAANRTLRDALESNGPFDLVYERYALWSFVGMEYARAMRVPGLLEVNAPLIEEQVEHRGLVDRVGAERVAQRAFDAATVVIAVSDAVAAYLQRYRGTEGRVQVIPNGVNLARFPANLKPSCPGRPGAFTVGFVGTMKPWHDLSVLIEAFAMLHRRAPNARLLVVGDGPERPRVVADLSRCGLLEMVHFTGSVAPSEVPGFLASMDTAVAPYPRQSQFYFSPLKVYEYMAAGLPVIASRVGQLAELLQDGVNGLLYAPGDVGALAGALDRLQCDRGLRVRLGEAARATVLQDHSWDAVARRILHLAGLEPPSPQSLSIEVSR